MQFRVLGPLEVCDDAGAALAITSPNQRALLAILLARRGSTISAPDTLAAPSA